MAKEPCILIETCKCNCYHARSLLFRAQCSVLSPQSPVLSPQSSRQTPPLPVNRFDFQSDPRLTPWQSSPFGSSSPHDRGLLEKANETKPLALYKSELITVNSCIHTPGTLQSLTPKSNDHYSHVISRTVVRVVTSPWKPARPWKFAYIIQFPLHLLENFPAFWSQNPQGKSLLRHSIHFASLNLLLHALQIKKTSIIQHQVQLGARCQAYKFQSSMFTSRRAHQSDSFSKHRASKSVSKSKRSFRDHATSTKKTEKSSRPGTSPATGR